MSAKIRLTDSSNDVEPKTYLPEELTICSVFAQAKLQNVLSASVTSRILIPNFSCCSGLYCLNKSLLLRVTGPPQ